ncbi:hypothetical protein RGU70_14350 [Herbaspirillum sp. RTI4]|uniref:hypothetical protein n=1 Tax=Herbaspirillum sp. RTI4 TaxID=3048640 RepID=UPI002AB51547|nr:hypothetical protein [Herbaspirillum sp. RTI4]MDY7579496.1 hypothetical protein [Herbaspirillum sp. RTI4]MEA9980410.1 hypothetical protein [Herbaspirillum sp. RTI4]
MFEFSKWADGSITRVFRGFDWQVASRGTLKFQKRILINGIASGRSSREFLVTIESEVLAELAASSTLRQIEAGKVVTEWLQAQLESQELGDSSDPPLRLSVDAEIAAPRG